MPISYRFLTPSGISLAVHDWGGTGDPVLLAHPTGFHGRVWAPVAAELVAAGRKVWSFDFRGHGDSDPSPNGEYRWEEFGKDALAVTDRLGLTGDPRLLAAGHSKGGASLLWGAAHAPGTYTRIWCFEPIIVPFESPIGATDNPLSAGRASAPRPVGLARRSDRVVRFEAAAQRACSPRHSRRTSTTGCGIEPTAPSS